MTEMPVDPFSMIDELHASTGKLPPRKPDVMQELPIPWGRIIIGVIVGMLLTPWVGGGLSWVKHHVGPPINAYCEWAYHLAGGR